jgi:hypothetical protein
MMRATTAAMALKRKTLWSDVMACDSAVCVTVLVRGLIPHSADSRSGVRGKRSALGKIIKTSELTSRSECLL